MNRSTRLKIQQVLASQVHGEEKTGAVVAKKVECYKNGKLVATYDSLTKCASALAMSRPMVKKCIDNGTVLDNGFLLKLSIN